MLPSLAPTHVDLDVGLVEHCALAARNWLPITKCEVDREEVAPGPTVDELLTRAGVTWTQSPDLYLAYARAALSQDGVE